MTDDTAQTGDAKDLAHKMRRGGRMVRMQGDPLTNLTGDGGFPLRVIVPLWLVVTAVLYAAESAGIKGNLPVPKLPHIDKQFLALLSDHPPSLVGNPLGDAVLAAGARGAAVCLAALVLPLFVLLWRRGRDSAKGSIYISFWGVSIGLPFVFFFVRDFLWPILCDLATGF
jgi:hypothetical protein